MVRPTFTQETVLAVIRSRGVFQINPLSYGSQRNIPLLKKMVADGQLANETLLAENRAKVAALKARVADRADGWTEQTVTVTAQGVS